MKDKKQVAETENVLIMDTARQKPYIDEFRQAYLFLREDKAEEFTKKTPGTFTKRAGNKDQFRAVCSDCYAAGAHMLLIQGNKTEELPLHKRDLDRRYYNSRLNASLTCLSKTKKATYLNNLAHCNFIVPVRIENRPEVKITYATVTPKGKVPSFLAFTDLEEFNKWREKTKARGYRPLEVNAAGLKRIGIGIGGKSGFLFNACGKNVELSAEMLKHIRTKDDEEETE